MLSVGFSEDSSVSCTRQCDIPQDLRGCGKHRPDAKVISPISDGLLGFPKRGSTDTYDGIFGQDLLSLLEF